jgi:hypothetical protein
MQDRYVGDIGDFVKLSLLDAVSQGNRLGIIWYLTPDEKHNRDGRHIDYLNDPQQWRDLDPRLFDCLHETVSSNERDITALERIQAFQTCKFASEELTVSSRPAERIAARAAWAKRARESVAGCDLVFLDPDNGLQPDGCTLRLKKAVKYATLSEIKDLRQDGRTIVLYQHQTHRAGGHDSEIACLAERLRQAGFDRVDALRARPYSPRVFFFLNATEAIRSKVKAFATKWGPNRTVWYEDPA